MFFLSASSCIFKFLQFELLIRLPVMLTILWSHCTNTYSASRVIKVSEECCGRYRHGVYIDIYEAFIIPIHFSNRFMIASSMICKYDFKPCGKSCGYFCPPPASPRCPKDCVYHEESSRCFQIVPGELSWTDARQQCSDSGGDLAIVRSDALRNRLAERVKQWVFLFVWGAETGPHWDVLQSFCVYVH